LCLKKICEPTKGPAFGGEFSQYPIHFNYNSACRSQTQRLTTFSKGEKMKIANRILTVVALSSCLAPMAMATPRSNFKAPAASSAATSIPASPRLAHAKALPSQRVKHGKQNDQSRCAK
jgi:hypothetical protein